MKVLLLGSTGQVGTAIEESCERKGIACVGLGREQIEITHPEEVESAIGSYAPDVVVNSVAFQAIDKCELHPEEAFSVNSIAVSHLAKLCDKNSVTLMHLGTHTVFDGTNDDYYTEEDVPNPINIYGASKNVGECLAMNLCRRHYVVRLPTVFGKRRAGYHGFLDKVLRWIQEGRHLRISDDKIDSFGYAADIADELLAILERGLPFGMYHVTNAGKASYYDLVLKIVRLLGADVHLDRAKDKDFPALGPKPLKTAVRSLKLEPLRGWEEALQAYMQTEVKA